MRALTKGGLFPVLVLAACAQPMRVELVESPLEGDSELVDAFHTAASEHGAPVELLAAVGYAESRWTMRDGEPSRMHGYGIMHLVRDASLASARRLTEASDIDLRTDARANIAGAAAVLARLHRETGSWAAALARFGPGNVDPRAGTAYAENIARIVREGASGVDDSGRSIVLAPTDGPSLFEPSQRAESDAYVGRSVSALRPDHAGVRWVGPACDYTPASRTPRYVVIHTCQGGFAGCWSWLNSCGGAAVSAHYVISSAGEIVQLVEDDDIAWHDACFNSQSIGIEHEGFVSDPGRWYTAAMYCSSARLVRSICDRYGIPCDRAHVLGHDEAPDCSDHTDPGSGWNWGLFMELVRCGCGGCCTPQPEVCNGRDDDCDGRVDENARAEVCNGRDDDCDGRVDEGLTRHCGTDVGECEFGTEVCAGGAWGTCTGGVRPIPEVCDERDNDCDGVNDDEQVCEIEEVVLSSVVYDRGGTSDLDGDGLADACARSSSGVHCYLASGHGFELEVPGPDLSDAEGFDEDSLYTTLRMGDVDGDGRADLCTRTRDGISCWRSTGTGFSTRILGPRLSDEAGWADVRYFPSIRLVDFDGDGRADLCARSADGLACHRSTGTAFSPPVLLPALSDEAGWGDVIRSGTLRMGDVDGDGRADVCARGPDGMVCWLSEGTRFGNQLVGPAWSDERGWSELQYWSTIRLVDVDGDGRADLCGRSPEGFRCHLSTGRGFGAPHFGPDLSEADGWSEREHYATLRMGDVNGDGTADLCGRAPDGVRCWLWTGESFGVVIIGPRLSDDAGWADESFYRTLRLVDVNADHRADLCARSAEGLRCWISNGVAFPTMVLGPEWSDDRGWAERRFWATIQLAGTARSASAPAPRAEPAHDDDGVFGCTVAHRARSSRDHVPLWLTALLSLPFLCGRRQRSRRVPLRGESERNVNRRLR